MKLTDTEKLQIKQQLSICFSRQPEVRKVMIFGSFLNSDDPGDVDLAIFQDSDEDYLPLAMRYRKLARRIAEQIPLDIIPLRASAAPTAFFPELESGQVIYER